MSNSIAGTKTLMVAVPFYDISIILPDFVLLNDTNEPDVILDFISGT